MKKFERVPLRTFKHRKLHYDICELYPNIEKIKRELEQLKIANSIDFTKRVLEKNPKIGTTENSKKAYEFILNNSEINKDSIRKLFYILSDGILDKIEENAMGKYYRKSTEYIMKKNDLTTLKEIGAKPEEIDYYMDRLIEYINEDTKGDEIDSFIKSQIIHLYFVYIHPYPNINGRTSRTLSLWHLIKHVNHPFIVCDRLISITNERYSKSIKSIYKQGNITEYLKYILKEIEKEFERLLIIQNIMKTHKLSDNEIETIESLLTIPNPTIESLIRFQNINNNYSSLETILDEQLKQLLDEKIIILEDDRLEINRKYSKKRK